MNESIRKSGIPVLGDFPWGTHFCQFYSTKEDLLETLVPYFKAGLNNNEFCMWVTSDPLTAKEAQESLRAALPHFDSYRKKGQLEIIPYSRWYTRKGRFDQERVLQGWLNKLRACQRRGFEGLRLSGNTFWLEKKDWKRFTQYERAVDSVIGKYKMLALCTYSLEKCGVSEIMDVMSNHGFALIKKNNRWQVFESSEQKHLDEKLRENERRMRTTEEIAHLGSWELDLRDNRLTWSDEVYRIFGLKPQGFKVTYEAFLEAIHPDDRKAVDDAYAKSLREGKDTYEIEHRIVRRSSAEVRFVHERCQHLRDGSGKIVRSVGMVQDITERKRSEEKISHLASFPERNPNPVIEVDTRGKILFLNKSAQEIIGKQGKRTMLKPFLPKDFVLILKAFRSGRKKGFTREVRIKNSFFLESIVYFPELKVARIYCLDITSRKEAESKLRWNEKRNLILSESAALLLSVGNPQKVIDQICRRAMKFLGCQVFCNFLAVPDKQKLKLNAYAGIPGEEARKIQWLEYGAVKDLRAWLAGGYGVRAYCCHPLLAGKEMIGAISFGTTLRDTFSADEIDTMMAIADVVEIALQRKRINEALLLSETRFRTNIELTNQISWVANAKGEVTQDVPSWRKFTGLSFEEAKGSGWTKAVHPDDVYHVVKLWRKAIVSKTPYEVEYRLLGKEGRYRDFLVRGIPLFDNKENIREWVGVCIDITERKETVAQLKKLNRTMKALSDSNRAMMYAVNEGEYLKEVCRIIVDVCGYPLVWIGFAQEDAKKSVLPVARAGLDRGYLKHLNLTWDDSPRGHGPTGTAIRTAAPYFCRDILNDPRFAPWRKNAFKRGFASSAAFPLLSDNKAFGALMIYAKEADAFHEDDVSLLSQLVNDLSYGITSLRIRAAHKKAEEALVQVNRDLEVKVSERTEELTQSNLNLIEQIAYRKEIESAIRIRSSVQKIMQRSSNRKEFMDILVRLLKGLAGCRYAGIRILNEDGDIPYESYVGFSREFWEKENWLSVSRDQCACIRVVTGRPLAQDRPCLTENGSFVTNDSLKFVEGLSEEEKARFRGVCIQNGFSSIAVVPIRYKEEIIAALHLADERPGVFPAAKIDSFERITSLIGEAIHKFDIEERIRQSYISQSLIGSLLRFSFTENSIEKILTRVLEMLFSLSWLAVESKGCIYLMEGETLVMKAQKNLPEYLRQVCARLEPGVCLCGKAAKDKKIKFFGEVTQEHEIRYEGMGPHGHYCIPILLGEKLLGVMNLYLSAHYKRDARKEDFLITITNALAGIIQRRLAEEELKKTHETVSKILEGLTEGFFATSREWNFTYVNAAAEKIMRVKRHALLGKVIWEAFPQLEVTTIYREFHRALVHQHPVSFDLFFEATKQWIDIHAYPSEEGLAVYFRDITEKKIAQEKLEEAERQVEQMRRLSDIGTLAATVAHELRNPLGVIRTAAYNIKRKASQAPIESHLGNIEKKITESEQIISNLLFYSRLKSPQYESVHIYDVLLDCIEVAKKKFSGAHVRIKKKINAVKDAVIECDAHQMNELFSNILNNAFEALKDNHGNVRVRAGKSADHFVEIVIEDDGIGMDPQDLENIFKPFYTKKSKGTGLGLSVCQQIVNLHKGQIRVESNKGKGSIFTVLLPFKRSTSAEEN